MKELEQLLSYKFKNDLMINRALTHSSYVNESKEDNIKSYERLEFLGDAVLELAISEILFDRFKDINEGALTKMRSKIVCENSLHEIALELDLGKYIKFSHGEKKNGGEKRPSILADVVESVIAAIYLESSYAETKAVIIKLFDKLIDEVSNSDTIDDYKSALQILVQANSNKIPVYQVISATGPEHDKTFKSAVFINNMKISEGIGKSKRSSEQDAAKKAYNMFINNENIL